MKQNSKWVPGKGYLKTCVVCEAEFFGRLDKVYCGRKYKDHATNSVARGIRNAMKIDHDSIRQNLKVIMQIYGKIRRGVVMTTTDELINLGFNNRFYSATVTFKHLEGDWAKLGDYAFQVQSDNVSVKVLKHL